MSATVSPATPAIRRVVFHPGPPAPERFTAHATERAQQYRLWLPPGKTLFQTIVDTFNELGHDHATIQMFDGDLSEAYFQMAPPDPSGKLIVAYGTPTLLPGGARIVMSNADLGKKADGQPILHCHASLLDVNGKLYGGHIPTDLCVIGEGGVFVWALVPDDGGFVVRSDDETLFPLLSPTR